MRPELDPSRAAAEAVGEIKLANVPRPVRSFGFHPDIAKLQPGDLVLVRPVAETWTARGVRLAQSGVYDDEHAKWIHAAIYIGRNLIAELDGLSGFKIESLWKYTSAHCLFFRRPQENRGLASPPPSADIDELTGHKIAIAALQNFNTDYSLLDAFRSGVDSMTARNPKGRVELRGKGAVCSTLYSDAVYQILERQAVPPISGAQLFHPADLSASPYLRDIDEVNWAKIVY